MDNGFNIFRVTGRPFTKYTRTVAKPPYTCSVEVPGVTVSTAGRVLENIKPSTVSRRPFPKHGFISPTRWSRTVQTGNGPVVQTESIAQSGHWVRCQGANRPGIRYSYDILRFALYRYSVGYPASLRSRCTNELLESLKSDGGANMGMLLMERKRTANMVSQRLDRITSSILNWRRKNPKHWVRMQRADKKIMASRKSAGIPSSLGLTSRERNLMRYPESWLELQYGWKPFMSDVDQALRAVDFAQQNNEYRFSKEKWVSSRELNKSLYRSTTNADVGVYEVTDSMFGCFIRVDYALNTSVLPQYGNLGLTNPLTLAWERLPWSFVVDWFLPIGSFLNTLDSTLGKTFLGGSRTELCRSNVTFDIPLRFSGRNYQIIDPGGIKRFIMNRTVLTSFPSPMRPYFKDPVSYRRIANGLSLLAVQFKR